MVAADGHSGAASQTSSMGLASATQPSANALRDTALQYQSDEGLVSLRRGRADRTRLGLAVPTPAADNRMGMAPALSSAKVEILERTDVYVVATWRRIMLLVWRAQANVAGIERSRKFFESWARELPGGAVFVVVIPRPRTRPPDEETRAAMERVSAAPEGFYRGTATLIEAEGFIAASVRAIMMRLQAHGVQGLPPNIFRTPAEVAAWAVDILADPGVTGERLAEAIRVARED